MKKSCNANREMMIAAAAAAAFISFCESLRDEYSVKLIISIILNYTIKSGRVERRSLSIFIHKK